MKWHINVAAKQSEQWRSGGVKQSIAAAKNGHRNKMAAKAMAAIGVARRRRENGVMAWRGIRQKTYQRHEK
jgi:hypothetical protein